MYHLPYFTSECLQVFKCVNDRTLAGGGYFKSCGCKWHSQTYNHSVALNGKFYDSINLMNMQLSYAFFPVTLSFLSS